MTEKDKVIEGLAKDKFSRKNFGEWDKYHPKIQQDFIDQAEKDIAYLESQGFKLTKPAVIPTTHFLNAAESESRGCFLYEKELNKANPAGLLTEEK